eukprot:scaffold51250_cov63-Phaeocystis_antarctica.AAC.1
MTVTLSTAIATQTRRAGMTTSHKSTSSSSHSNATGLGQHLHGRGQGPGPDLVYDRMAVAMLARREPR